MLTDINPKLPMRDKMATRDFYIDKLGFQEYGSEDFAGYLMLQKTIFKFTFLSLNNLTQRKLWTSIYQNR